MERVLQKRYHIFLLWSFVFWHITQQYLAQCDVHADGKAVIDTKWAVSMHPCLILINLDRVHPFRNGANLKAQSIRKSLNESIKALGDKKIRVLYLHGPDRRTPLEETAEAINALYKEGLLWARFAVLLRPVDITFWLVRSSGWATLLLSK
jgi:predicted oxidoreductase